MPVSSADVKVKLSTKDGAAGNSDPSTPAESLGKYISTTEVVSGNLHNLFDQISGSENQAGDTEYRCIFIHNSHASITYQNVKVYILSQAAGGADIEIGVDPTAASAIGSAGAQAVEIADEDTAPAGVVFSAPVDLATAIVVGDLAAGQCRAIWLKRTINNVAALANDSVTLRIQGESV